jgi:recombination protein RecA
MVDIKSLYAEAKKKLELEDPKSIAWVLPTGSMLLDRIIGIGGYPSGRIIEIYGAEHSGKTTLALHACKEAQKLGETFCFIDMECALDLEYCKSLGLQGEANKDWLHIHVETGERAFTTVEYFLNKGVKVFVIDSVATMISQSELSGDYGDANMGSQARMMSAGLKKLVGLISQRNAIVIFINQTRMKIGMVFGNPETTTGGSALKFYSSIRLQVAQGAKNLDVINEGELVGKTIRVKTVKNKVAPPLKECSFPLVWGRGIDTKSEIFDVALQEGVILKQSSFYSFGETKANGRNNFILAMDENAILKEVQLKWKK